MAEVIPFPGPYFGNLPVAVVIQGAADAGLETVLILGRDAEGVVQCFSSDPRIGELLLLMERAKAIVLSNRG